MDNFLARISNWGWKKGQEKQVSLIKQATRDTPFEHRMYQINGLWVVFLIFLILGLITVSLAFIGHPIFLFFEKLLIGGEGVTNIGLAVYGFYLFWIFPAIFLGTTLSQVFMLLFPGIGNTYTGIDMVKVLAEMEGNGKLMKQAMEYKVPKDVVLEKTRFIDLTWIRRQSVIQMSKATLLVTLVLSPFMFLSINNHFSKLADDTLVYSRFFQLGTEVIEIEDIDMVTVELNWEEDHLEPYYEIELNDGRSIDLWENGIAAPDLDKILEIATYLKSQDVFHFLIPFPSMSSLNEKTRNEFTEFYSSLRAL
jgi:hypothetical protein